MRTLHGQSGAAAVELALVGAMLMTLLLGIVGFAHWIMTMEMVSEATRTGARMAVVCDMNAASIKAAIQNKVPQLSLTNAQVGLEYVPAGCVKATCQAVSVSLSGVSYVPWFPAGASSFTVPPFTTSLPRESLESLNAAGESNPVCS
jgi:Flp pilus assembly protein TadG